MGAMLFRTVQVLIATLLIALATIGIMWVLGLIDPAAAQTSAYRIGGVLGICLVAALAMVAVFAIGGNKTDDP
jgi:hypothetical protein